MVRGWVAVPGTGVAGLVPTSPRTRRLFATAAVMAVLSGGVSAPVQVAPVLRSGTDHALSAQINTNRRDLFAPVSIGPSTEQITIITGRPVTQPPAGATVICDCDAERDVGYGMLEVTASENGTLTVKIPPGLSDIELSVPTTLRVYERHGYDAIPPSVQPSQPFRSPNDQYGYDIPLQRYGVDGPVTADISSAQPVSYSLLHWSYQVINPVQNTANWGDSVTISAPAGFLKGQFNDGGPSGSADSSASMVSDSGESPTCPFKTQAEIGGTVSSDGSEVTLQIPDKAPCSWGTWNIGFIQDYPDSGNHSYRTMMLVALVTFPVCYDVEGVWARGSDQQVGTGSDWNRFASSMDTWGNYDLREHGISWNTHELSVYPAVPVVGWTNGGYQNLLGASLSGGGAFDYGTSVNIGADELRGYIAQRLNACPSTLFILGGYSQGAQVVGDSYRGLLTDDQRNHVVYNVLVGDPKLSLPEGRGIMWQTPACRGEWLSPWRRGVPDCNTDHGSLGAREPYLPASFLNSTGLWCNDGDLVCGSGWSTGPHLQYAVAGGPIAQGVLTGVRRARERLAPGVTGLAAAPFATSAQAAGLDKLDAADIAPVATLPLGAYYAASGQSIRLDASGSYSPISQIVRWDWDLDGDGVYEVMSEEPVVTHTFAPHFSGTVRLRVADADDRVADTSAKIFMDYVAPEPTTVSADDVTVVATENETSATLNWTATDSPTKGWVVSVNGLPLGVASPDARTIVVTDLKRGEAITFSIAPMSDVGEIGQRRDVELEPYIGPGVVPVMPRRWADWSGVQGFGPSRCVDVAEVGAPADVSGVLVNVASVDPPGSGNAVVFPSDGSASPVAPVGASVQFEPGRTVAAAALSGVGPDGRVCVASQTHAGSSRVVMDVSAFFTAGSGVVLDGSRRLLDTRQEAAGLAGRSVREVQVGGTVGVPADAKAVVLSVTAVTPGGAGHLRVFPATGTSQVPGIATVNYVPGVTKANAAVVPLGKDGKIGLYSDTSAGAVQVVLDVTGYVTADSAAYQPVDPVRVLDTRPGAGALRVVPTLTANTPVPFDLAATGLVPAGATSVVLNVTAIAPTSVGNLRVYPDDDGTGATAPPDASNINYIPSPGRAIPNLVMVKVPADGKIMLYSNQPSGSVNVAVDLVGYTTRP